MTDDPVMLEKSFALELRRQLRQPVPLLSLGARGSNVDRAPGARICYVRMIEPEPDTNENAEVLLSVCGYNPGERLQVESLEGVSLSQEGTSLWVISVLSPTEEVNGEHCPPHWVPLVSGCNTWWLTSEGHPIGGSITFSIQINNVSHDVVFPSPCSIADSIAALELHPEVEPGDIIVVGGSLPLVGQKISFTNNPTSISLVSNLLEPSWTAPPAYYWEPG